MPADITIVIPNFNGAHVLGACLDALAGQTVEPAEIVVVDNGSADDSAAIADGRPGVRVLRLGGNHGFAGGANRGIAASTTELVAVVNSDAYPQPDWLETILAAPRDEGTWAWGSVLVSATTGLVESAGDHFDRAGFAYKLARGRSVDDLPDSPYPVFAPPGAAPVFVRERFHELGGYDEHFFLYYEDIDLAFRARLRGWTALLVPAARVRHELGASGGSSVARFHVARNQIWCTVRNHPDPSWRVILRRWANELRWNQPRSLWHREVRGRLAALRGLPRVARERRALRASWSLDAAAAQRLFDTPPELD
jgi:GT2 family glycosyltransferase